MQLRFFYPLGNKLVKHLDLPEELQKDFDAYNGNMPMGLVIEKSIEYTIYEETRTIPAYIYRTGDMFAYEKLLTANQLPFAIPLYHAYSGARSCFCVSNLGNETLFAPLKSQLKKNVSAPKSLFYHQPFFKTLYEDIVKQHDWKLKVLYFSGSWKKAINESKDLIPLRLYLFQQYWKRAELSRVRTAVDYLCSTIFNELTDFKPEPSVTGAIQYFTSLLLGAYPGYTPIISNDDIYLPTNEIQDILLSRYKLPNSPTIIAPSYFNDTNHIYYALSYPSAITFSREYLPQQTTIKKLDLFARLTQAFFNKMMERPRLKNTYIGSILPITEIKYFHTHMAGYQFDEIQSINALEKYDRRFQAKDINLPLSKSSPFLRGLISFKKLE